MGTMYIGGALSGHSIEHSGTSQIAIAAVKGVDDFAQDPLSVSSYKQEAFVARKPNGEILEVEFRVLEGLSMDDLKSIVLAHTHLEIQSRVTR